MKYRQYTLDESVFDVVTDKSAYWIGMLLADGCILDHHSGMPAVKLSLKKLDEDHIIKFSNFIQSSYPLHRYADQTYTSVNSTILVNSLANWGIVPRKTFIAYPHPLLCSNRHFWRGMVDGDGWINIVDGRPKIGLCGTYLVCNKFKKYVESLVTNSKREVSKHGSVYQYQIAGRTARKIIEELYQPEDQPLALDRKFNVAMEIHNDSNKMFISYHRINLYKAPLELTPELEDDICSHYLSGKSSNRISEVTKINRTRVLKVLHEHKIIRPPRCVLVKISKEIEVNVCNQYQAGKSGYQLAKAFLIGVVTVQRILKRNGIKMRPRFGWENRYAAQQVRTAA